MREDTITTYTMKDDGCCRVVNTTDLYTWKLHKNDGDFVAPFCNDPNRKNDFYNLAKYDPAPGLMMWKLRYRDAGDCWSVNRKDLGFWWIRGADNRVVMAKEN